MSLFFGWILDGDRPDVGDLIGSMIAMVGVLVIMLWPRN
jgi:drug/metabolite transporter superfamily protein YnfA